MSKVIEITDETFEKEVLKSDVPTEVDFWAPWCGPCLIVAPVYDKLAEKYDNFKFCKINVDENPETAMRYQIQSIPMQLFFADGEKVDDLLGAVPAEIITAKVKEIMRKFPTDEKGRLKVILSSWFEKNKQYSEKFSKWTKKTKDIKNDPVYDSVLKAASEMERASERLYKLLSEL